MRYAGSLIAVAISALVLGADVQAAPGGGTGGKQAGAKPKTEQPAESKDRTQTKAREQVEENNPGAGKQIREQEEKTRQNREESPGKGQATSAEMQQRQQERKEIQEQYRSTDEKGEKAGKKPWWKFWGDEAG